MLTTLCFGLTVLLITMLQSLFESGMRDSAEQSQLQLAHPIKAAERLLELLGPVWKASAQPGILGLWLTLQPNFLL
jgi:hypothetical protein